MHIGIGVNSASFYVNYVGEEMKYAYTLCLMIGAYLLFEEGMELSKTLFLYFLLLLAFLGFIVEWYEDPRFVAWLNHYF